MPPRCRRSSQAVEIGRPLDPWQRWLVIHAMEMLPDGRPRFRQLLVLVARQNGKTELPVRLSLWWQFVCLVPLILGTSTKLDYAKESWMKAVKLAEKAPGIPVTRDDRKRWTRQANGEQEIEFRNGSIIMFGARSQGFGRGFDVVDAEVFDEAQILDDKALEDMVAATNQTQHPHGALIFFIGTPPRPADPSEAFSMKRAKALRGETSDTIYIEMSADPDADLDSHEQWGKANPSFPKRTPLESMLRLRANLPSDDAWRREALGIWDEIGKTHVFGPGAWEVVAAAGAKPGEVAGLALAVSTERDSASIVAVDRSGDVPLVGVADLRDGVGWVVPEAKRLQGKYGCPVVIRGTGPGSDLIPALEAAGVELTIARANDYADACAGIFDAVRENLIRHPDHPALNLAVAGAHKRRRDDRWVWDPRNSEADIQLLVGATLALWVANQPDKPRRAPMATFV